MAFRELSKLVSGRFKPSARFYSVTYLTNVYDPPYLELMKPQYPQYDAINVQIKGYDFALLESYQSVVNRLAVTVGLEVGDCWAQPATTTKITRFKPKSTVIDAEYNLKLYERNIQILEVKASLLPIFVELIQTALPQGVQITLQEHTEEIEEDRYVPDYELEELQSQLDHHSKK